MGKAIKSFCGWHVYVVSAPKITNRPKKKLSKRKINTSANKNWTMYRKQETEENIEKRKINVGINWTSKACAIDG